MKGVIMLVNEFPPLQTGGAERQAERLAFYLKKKGWPIWVITRRVEGLSARQNHNGIEIIRPLTVGFGKLKTISFVIGTLVSLWSLRSQYSILHAHLVYGAAFAGVIAARLLRKKIIVKLGNSGEFGDIQVSRSTWRGRLRLAVLRRWADVIIALDQSIYEEIMSIGIPPERVRRIANGIDVDNFLPLESRLVAQKELKLPNKIVAVYVGRLSEQKSLPTLFNAFQRALLDCSDLHLLVVGDGPDRLALEEQAQSLGIYDSITFAGHQADVRPYLNAADIFVLPSQSEGISNSLLEAMSAGLACIVSMVGGNFEILDQGRCGILLPPGETLAWSNGLVELGMNPEKRMALGIAAQKHVKANFDFNVVGLLYENLYNELLL